MTQPCSTHDNRGDRLQEKGLYAGPYLTGGDWALVLPTTKLAATSLQSSENFIQIGPSIQKLFMIFQNTDRQSHKWINPVPYMGMAKNYALFFLPFHSWSELALLAHSVSFRIIPVYTWSRIQTLDTLLLRQSNGRYFLTTNRGLWRPHPHWSH